jgi:histidine triad (HIT) family protein
MNSNSQALTLILFLVCVHTGYGQSTSYLERKNKLIAETSPFEKIISRQDPREIEYEDDQVAVFQGLRPQAPVHWLIVPKKRINTINEATEEDTWLLGHMIMVARKIAAKYKIAETGYRLVINTNEDAGQSVFHIHMHLLGGTPLGPMVDQINEKK